jgi:hypothetical protein
MAHRLRGVLFSQLVIRHVSFENNGFKNTVSVVKLELDKPVLKDLCLIVIEPKIHLHKTDALDCALAGSQNAVGADS